MAKEALVVQRDILFADKNFQGFLSIEEHDFISKILDNFEYHIRGEELESNPDFQQIIPYVWIINPKTKQIFAYKRSSGQDYKEKRLHNKFSCGIGGHIDKEDSKDPITNAMMRELKEEITMASYPQPKIIGYLNDDSEDVGKVHFGIVALVETNQEVSKGSNEITSGKFYTIEELESEFNNQNNDTESWTKLSWPFIKNYLNSK